jgi:hypothetical protein
MTHNQIVAMCIKSEVLGNSKLQLNVGSPQGEYSAVKLGSLAQQSASE